MLPNLTPIEVSEMAQSINDKIIENHQKTGIYYPLNCWYFLPALLLSSSWFILNFVYWLKDPIDVGKIIWLGFLMF